MRRLRVMGLLLAFGFLALTLACQRPAPDTRAADEQTIRQADSEWVKAAAAKELERTLSYWADDASVFPPNAPAVTGKEAIRAYVSQGFATPGFSITWETTKVEVSRAGDLAYAIGTNEFRMNDPKGKPVVQRGKGITVWKKQLDGSWKCIVDIWNSDPPPGPARR